MGYSDRHIHIVLILASAMNKRRQIRFVLAALVALIVTATTGFMVIEGWSFVDAFYMTMITISTVGFREVHTMSPIGRVFASLVIIAGVGTAIYAFTRLGQFMLEGELLDILGRKRMTSELRRLHGHFVICGYGRIGRPVAEGMKKDGRSFCVIDRNAEIEDELRSREFIHIIGDATDEDVLQEAGVERADALLALLPSDADNLYLTMSAKSLNPNIRVIARGRDERAEMKLKRGGADRVVSPYLIAASRVVSAAVKPSVVDFMESVTHRQYLPLTLEEVVVAERSALANRSLAESEIRTKIGVIVVAIKDASGEMMFNPDPARIVVAGDLLIAMGEASDLEKLERTCGAEA